MAKSLSIVNKLNLPHAAFLFCCMLIAGMFTTHFFRVLSGIGTFGLLLTALLALFQENTLSNLRKFPYFTGFILIFIVHLLGFLHPDLADYKDFERDLVMKLSLFIIPFACAVLPAISRRRLNQFYYVFIICVFLGTIYSTGYYLSNFEEVNEMYIHSDVMETPTNHVRFSLMVAFAVFVGFRFWQQGFFVFRNWEKWLILGITVWLYIFLHVLAVRSGLVAFYAAAGLGLAFDFFIRRKFKRSFLIGIGLLAGLVVAFFTMPTFYNKFYLTIADMQQVSNVESAHDYSITGRVYSYKVAMEVFQEHPVFGVGVGNLEPELDKKYETLFPEILDRGHLLPHNQFLYSLTAFGIAGLVVFLLYFYYPLFRFAGRFEPFFLLHYFIITVSFLFESTLETQVGLNYSIIFILLPLWYFKADPAPTATWKNGTFFA